MCGIAGIYNLSSQSLSNGQELIQKMNAKMAHRGPDAKGVWSNQSQQLFLGHQRLSILDLSIAGNQPMTSSSLNSTIVFNGEIYNFEALKNNLPKVELKSTSDTEVLLELFAANKLKIEDLNGMFSLALWNEEKQQLLLARDRSGQKPLYYTVQENKFAFSSQLSSLLELPWVKRELDEQSLYDFLTYNQLAPPQTMFKNIYKFKPGHQMLIDKNGIQSYQSFWELNLSNQLSSSQQNTLEDNVYQSLEKSVEARMLSDVPVGAFLSGGVDSSAIVALMMQHTEQPIKTYSIGFEGQDEYDELKYASSVAKRFKTNHFEKIVSPQDFQDFLANVVEVFDEPIADSTSIPIYFLAELAKSNQTKVILTGDGADELFGGYSNWMKYLNAFSQYQSFKKMPKALKKAALYAYGKYKAESPLYDILNRASNNQELFWSGAKGFKEYTKRDFLTESFQARNAHLNSYHQVEQISKRFEALGGDTSTDYLNYLCFTGFENIIPNLYANRLDKLSMAHSVEGRSPFLDPELIQLAFQIPSSLKVKNGEGKYILKKSLERILPNEVLYRKKKGFCVPLKEWGAEIMIDHLEQNIASFCRETDIFKEKAIRAMLIKFKNGNQAYVNAIWTIYFLISWHKRWISA